MHVQLFPAVAGERREIHESPSRSTGYLYTAGDSLSRQASFRRTVGSAGVCNYVQSHRPLTLTLRRRQSRHPDRDFFNIGPCLFMEVDML